MCPTLKVVAMPQSETTIGVSNKTHELVRSCKRGGESFDTLLRKMARAYDPDDVEEHR